LNSENTKTTLRVAIAGGGTGGHIIPALAIADGLKSAVEQDDRFKSVDFVFFGSDYGMEKTLVPEAGYRLESLPIRGLQRSLNLKNLGLNLVLPIRILRSTRQANRRLRSFDPHIVVGTGGYASAIPIRQAISNNYPFVLQEQNSYPGLTTRLFADKAREVFLTYGDARRHLPEARVSITGNPVRAFAERVSREDAAAHFELQAGVPTLLIVGGSQGARALNRHFIDTIDTYLEKLNMQVLWQSGKADFAACAMKAEGNARIKVVPFIKQMHKAYSLADLVVCRAGAMTLTELCHFGRPSILVPLPSAAGNHQEHNARTLERGKAAVVLLEKDLNLENMVNLLQTTFTDGGKLKAMAEAAQRMSRPDATKNICSRIMEIVKINA